MRDQRWLFHVPGSPRLFGVTDPASQTARPTGHARDTELHPDGGAQRGEVVQMVRLATHAMDFDGAVWHDEQAVRVVRAAVLGDHRRGPGMRRLQLLGNDVRTRDALSRISDDLRGADVHGRADVDDAPVLRFVQGYGMLSQGDQIIYSYLFVPTTVEGDVNDA